MPDFRARVGDIDSAGGEGEKCLNLWSHAGQNVTKSPCWRAPTTGHPAVWDLGSCLRGGTMTTGPQADGNGIRDPMKIEP